MKVIVVAKDEGHFQGELYVGPVTEIPEEAQIAEAERVDGLLIVGHSETGHHHVVEAADARLIETADPLVCYLVAEGAYADLVHQRDHDRHLTLRLDFGEGGGARKIVRQREMSPSGWVRAAD